MSHLLWHHHLCTCCVIRHSAELSAFIASLNPHNNFIQLVLLFLILQIKKLGLHPAHVKQSWDSNPGLSTSKNLTLKPLSGRAVCSIEAPGQDPLQNPGAIT